MKAKRWVHHYLIVRPSHRLLRWLVRGELKLEAKASKRVSLKAGDITIYDLDTDHFYGVRRRRVEAVAAAINQMSRRSAYYKRLIAAEIDEIFVFDIKQRYYWLYPAKIFLWDSKELDKYLGFGHEIPEMVDELHCSLIEFAVTAQERRQDILLSSTEIRPKVRVAIDDYYGIPE